jgi:hypothetical protein
MLLVSGFSVLVFGNSHRVVCHFQPAGRFWVKPGAGALRSFHSAALQLARRSSKVGVW